MIGWLFFFLFGGVGGVGQFYAGFCFTCLFDTGGFGMCAGREVDCFVEDIIVRTLLKIVEVLGVCMI